MNSLKMNLPMDHLPVIYNPPGRTLIVLQLSDFGYMPWNVGNDPYFGWEIAHAIIRHVDYCYNNPVVLNDWMYPLYDDNLVVQLIFDKGGFEKLDTLTLERFIDCAQAFAKNVCQFYIGARLNGIDHSKLPMCKLVASSNRLTREVAFVY